MSVDQAPSHAPSQAQASLDAVSSHDSLTGEEVREQDMSEDEDLSPDQPSFVGLFKPQLFCSFLHKAKSTTRLGITRPLPASSGEEVGPSVPLFEDPTFEAEDIPTPKLFRDVVQRQ